jgi:hypothetical protein
LCVLSLTSEAAPRKVGSLALATPRISAAGSSARGGTTPPARSKSDRGRAPLTAFTVREGAPRGNAGGHGGAPSHKDNALDAPSVFLRSRFGLVFYDKKTGGVMPVLGRASCY